MPLWVVLFDVRVLGVLGLRVGIAELRLQLEQDLLKLKDAVSALHARAGADNEFSSALSTIASFDASRFSDQDPSRSLEVTRPSHQGHNASEHENRTMFEHGPVGPGNDGASTTGSAATIMGASARRAAIEIFTATVSSHEDASEVREADKLLAAEQRLQRYFQTHLLRDLTAVLATVHSDREFRVRRLVDDCMIDAHEDEEADAKDESRQNSPDEANDIDAIHDGPTFPFALPSSALVQPMPRLNVLDLQAALNARPHEEEVITTGDEEEELTESTEHEHADDERKN